MRRPFLVVLLAIGTVAGYGSAFSSARCRWQQRSAEWGANSGYDFGPANRFEERVADICTRAAQRTWAASGGVGTPGTAAVVAPAAPAPAANVQVQAPAPAPAAPAVAPIQQISQAPGPVVIINTLPAQAGGVQVITPAPVAAPVAPAPATAAPTPAR